MCKPRVTLSFVARDRRSKSAAILHYTLLWSQTFRMSSSKHQGWRRVVCGYLAPHHSDNIKTHNDSLSQHNASVQPPLSHSVPAPAFTVPFGQMKFAHVPAITNTATAGRFGRVARIQTSVRHSIEAFGRYLRRCVKGGL